MLETSFSPKGCICPNESYTCEVKLATEVGLIINNRTEISYTLSANTQDYYEEDGFKIQFSGVLASSPFGNFTVILSVIELPANEINVTCTGFSAPDSTEKIINTCLVGNNKLKIVYLSYILILMFRSCITTY